MNFKDILSKVEEFQNATDQPVNKTPCIGEEKHATLRYQLMAEENKEYLVANLQSNQVEILDSAIDQLYVLAGTINFHGIQDLIEPAFNLVHANNMTKVGPDGKVLRNPEGKILKPEGFKPVDLKQLFKQ